MKDLEEKDFSIPVHRTNNLFLRFLANKIFSPIYDLFLGLYLRWGTTYRVKDNMFDNEYFNKEEWVSIHVTKVKVKDRFSHWEVDVSSTGTSLGLEGTAPTFYGAVDLATDYLADDESEWFKDDANRR